MVNWERSNLVLSQRVVYLRVILDSLSFRASPFHPRVEKLLSLGNEFLSSFAQPVASWRVLLEVLSSLNPLVPGSRLRIQSLQLLFHRSWDQEDNSTLAWWDVSWLRDLGWWLVQSHLELGISLAQVSPDLDFWSDASDVGWGAHLADEVASGLWSPEESNLSINTRELLAVERGCSSFIIFCPDPQWPCLWTIPQPWRICVSKEGLVLPSSTLLHNRSSVG